MTKETIETLLFLANRDIDFCERQKSHNVIFGHGDRSNEIRLDNRIRRNKECILELNEEKK